MEVEGVTRGVCVGGGGRGSVCVEGGGEGVCVCVGGGGERECVEQTRWEEEGNRERKEVGRGGRWR